MHVDNFVNDKIQQLIYYLQALLKQSVHYTEVELFIWDIFEEWAQLNITDDMPSTTKERVFWHLLHELKLGPLAEVNQDLLLTNEIKLCVNYLNGQGTYPIHCIGWRPI